MLSSYVVEMYDFPTPYISARSFVLMHSQSSNNLASSHLQFACFCPQNFCVCIELIPHAVMKNESPANCAHHLVFTGYLSSNILHNLVVLCTMDVCLCFSEVYALCYLLCWPINPISPVQAAQVNMDMGRHGPFGY